MKCYNTDDYPRAETYTADTELPNVQPGQWVISHGMFGMPFKPTCNGFLWQVENVTPKEHKREYLKANVRCAATNEIMKLRLSMLYVLPEPPDAELLAEYTKAYNAWINRP